MLLARYIRRAWRRTIQAVRWRRWDFEGIPVLFANSFPKSGTHLLTQVLQGFSAIGPAVDSGLPAVVTFWGDSGMQRDDAELLSDLQRYLPGDIGYGHLHASPAIMNALADDKFAPYFIIRDPRDVVVSHVHYVTEIEPNHIHHDYYLNELKSFEERLQTSILGRPFTIPQTGTGSTGKNSILFPDISARFQPYLGWCQHPAVLTIHYEEFLDNQAAAIRKILDHAVARGFPHNIDPEKAVITLQEQLNPRRSPTFRTGKAGGWKEAFTPEIKSIFKETAGDLLISLGYEKDKNW